MSDWVVTLQQDLALHCKRCGETYAPALPIPANLYVAMSKEFIRDHSGCVEVPADLIGEVAAHG